MASKIRYWDVPAGRGGLDDQMLGCRHSPCVPAKGVGLTGSYQWVTGPALNPLIFDDLRLFFEDYLNTGSLFVQQSQKGFGDISVPTRYAPATASFNGWYPSIAVKVKLPVAKSALTTGKTDVTVTADIAKMFGRWSVFALASYTVRGDSAALPRRNTFAGSLGADYRINQDWSAGASYDVRETSSISGAPPQVRSPMDGTRFRVRY